MEFKTNPFESGHIKNYILLYAAIVVIMVLFFFASDLWIEPKEIEKKVFETNSTTVKETEKTVSELNEEEEKFTPKFQLLEEGY